MFSLMVAYRAGEKAPPSTEFSGTPFPNEHEYLGELENLCGPLTLWKWSGLIKH